MRLRIYVIAFSILFTPIWAPSAAFAATNRVALVIGNSAYKSGALQNPEADAKAIAKKLKDIGFDSDLAINLNGDALRQRLHQFALKARAADDALIYYAGHGLEAEGRNYLMPVDASLDDRLDIAFKASDLNLALTAVGGAKSLRLVILDACRNNSLGGSVAPLSEVSRGFAPVFSAPAPSANTLVVYSAEAGKMALDGKPGDHSPFAKALLEFFDAPGMEIREMLGQVRDAVMTATGQRQQPFTYGSLGRNPIYLVPPREVSTSIEVANFAVPADVPGLNFLKTKIERNFVDLFADARMKVRAALTSNSDLDPAHYSLGGSIVDGNGKLLVTAELRDGRGNILGRSQIEGAKSELEEIYKVLPEALIYAMDISLPSLKKFRRAYRSTETLEAYAQFLQARRDMRALDFDAAIRRMKRAIEIEPRFAMGYWEIGEIYRFRGNMEEAKNWYAQASAINADHPRISISPEHESQPVPALLKHARTAEAKTLLPGATYKLIAASDYGISIHAWSFDAKNFQLRSAEQRTATGDSVKELLLASGAVLAINGGFFDIDMQHRLSPSGLLIIDGREIHALSDKAGSGVLYSTESGSDIVARADFKRAGVDHAVQGGPILVERGGKMGIYKNDFDRQSRSAICLARDSITAVAVDGGISLYELAEFLSANPANGGMGCDVALNLDGGPSTQVYFSDGQQEIYVPGRWRMPSAVVIASRPAN